MKLKKLSIGEAIDRNLHIPTGQSCAQFRSEDVSIASGHNHLASLLCLKASQRVLIVLDVLHLVDKQVVMASYREVFCDIDV
jgi:hypothetical protein